MSQPLELPDPVYDALKRVAESSGTTPVGWIAAHLPKDLQPQAAAPSKTLADLFRGRVGRIHSGGQAALSERCAEKFADYLEDKRRKGQF